jgi:23S rRNA A1618 N6-methylase RlmF
LNIASIIKKRTTRDIYSLSIYGKENIIKFQKEIGFLHPSKNEKLKLAINDFVDYNWDFPKENKELIEFISNLIKSKAKMKKNNWVIRLISNRENNLIQLQGYLYNFFDIESRINKRINGIGTTYYEMSINKKDEVAKLINYDLLNKQEKEKWLNLKK